MSSARRLQPVLLVRHAETDWNDRRIVQGQSDGSRLTDAGTAQAHEVATRLTGHVDTIVSSDLTRAVQTATVIAEVLGLTFTVDEALRERSFGDLEGGPLDDLTPAVTGITEGRVTDERAHPRGGESLRELSARVVAAAERLRVAAHTDRVLVVTHGGAIRVFRAYCDGMALLDLVWDAVTNCSTWTVSLPEDAKPG